jgi:hypothetical protein
MVIALISALGGGWAFLTSASQSKRLRSIEKDKIDSQAFDRAQEIYERGIREMSRQMDNIHEELEKSREIILSLRSRVFSLENVLIKMRAEMIYLGLSTSEFDKALLDEEESDKGGSY